MFSAPHMLCSRRCSLRSFPKQHSLQISKAGGYENEPAYQKPSELINSLLSNLPPNPSVVIQECPRSSLCHVNPSLLSLRPPYPRLRIHGAMSREQPTQSGVSGKVYIRRLNIPAPRLPLHSSSQGLNAEISNAEYNHSGCTVPEHVTTISSNPREPGMVLCACPHALSSSSLPVHPTFSALLHSALHPIAGRSTK
jgi:hypothetical protein